MSIPGSLKSTIAPGSGFARRASVLVAVALALGSHAAARASPFGWRGDGTGRFPTARPPLRWSRSLNVAWSTAMPAWGNASPAIGGDRLYVCAEPTTVIAVRLSDGGVLWRREVSYADTLAPEEADKARAEMKAVAALGAELDEASRALDRARREARKKSAAPDARTTLEDLQRRVAELKARYDRDPRYRPPDDIPTVGNSSSTPVTDGRNVFAIFGNFVVASFSEGGALRWARYLPPDDPTMHGYTRGQSASPLLLGRRLIVPLGRLRALDADTGRTLWEGPEYRDYGTPVAARLDGGEVIVTPDGGVVRADDGRRLARDLHLLYYVGPIVSGRQLFFAGNVDSNAPDPAEALSFDLPAGVAEPFAAATRFRVKLPNGRQYTTPLHHRERLFIVDDRATLRVMDAARGEIVAERALGLGGVFPSPTLAGDYLFVSGSEGATVVLEAEPPFREVARNQLEPFRSSPVFAGTRMYVRALERLYCIEERGPGATRNGAPKKRRR